MLRRILVVASTLPAAPDDGTPAFVLDLATALVERDHALQIAILAPHHAAQTVTHKRHSHFDEHRFSYMWPRSLQQLAGRGILPSIDERPLRLALVPFLFVAEFVALWRLVRAWKPDVIHAHWFTPQGVVAAIVSRLTGVPWVLTTHASDVAVWRRIPFLGEGIVRGLISTAHRISAVSERTLARTRDFFSADEWATLAPRTAIIPMGVDVRSLRAAAAARDEHRSSLGWGSQFVVLFLGRLTGKKGIAYLLEAYARGSRDGVRLIIAGDGPHRAALEALATKLGVASNVEFLGAVGGDRKLALLAASDVVVVPSVVTESGDAEGLPVVVLEALAAGTPCIASNESGAPELLVHGENGFVTPARDVAALSAALTQVRSMSPEGRAQLAARARETAERVDWSVIAKRHREHLFTFPPERVP